MKVSVIIPNFNGIHFLKPCLDSLKLEKDNINEIIIIDNGSTDDSVDFINNYRKDLRSNSYNELKDSNDLKIELIENKENLGFSMAVNQGIKSSKSDFVFLLNNDVEIAENTILNLLKCINKSDKIFSVSSKMIQYNNRDLIDDAGDNYTILGWTKKRGDNKPLKGFNKSKIIFSSCAGAALYRKSIFGEIGLFDENFFAYMEDVDIGYRSNIFGYKNYYCPNAIVYHVGSGSTIKTTEMKDSSRKNNRYNEFKIKIAARNNIIVPYKNMPWPQLLLNSPFLFLGYLIKFFFFLSKGYGKTYLSGLIEGIKNLKNIKRIKYNHNLKTYLKIELKLILNIFS
jgi:GT2 family glycosyltransferase